jgi:serine/threonine protein kinase
VFEPGTQLGRYEIQRRLGRGGMGTVYVAHDPVLGRMVAIKVFAGDLDMADARERFGREARAAAALNHPNIVTIYDFGEFESQPYIVMEYVAGETVASLIRRKVPVAFADKLRWMEELCAGAAFAHRMSVVHRDIKPANLMIDRTGRLKILDFGIARILGYASNTSFMIGTPGYMAPEQITGDPVDHRADQFSIGVVFYEVLAYTEAFPGDTLPAITHRILTQEPEPLTSLVADMNPDLAAVVNQALKKNVVERFKDTDAMREAVARVRRHLDSDDSWSAPTIPITKDLRPPAGPSRGTGSARRRVSEAAGVAELTPPPDPRLTDRDVLARRRSAQVEAAVTRARELLVQQQPEAAFDMCQQAIMLDETHTEALALAREIDTALKLRVDIEPAEDADLMEALADDSALAVRVGEAAPSTHTDVEVRPQRTPPPDATMVVPGRRTPHPATQAMQPVSAPPAVVSPSAPKALVEKPRGVDVRVGLRAVSQTVADLWQWLRAVAPASLPRTRTIWVSSAAIVLVGVLAVTYLTTRGPAPTGTLVIDAVPWATVTAIRGNEGTPQALSLPASTPLSLVLPPGTYQVTLTGPAPEAKVVTVTASVGVGGISVVPLTRFQALTAEDYFEQYLGSAAPDAPTVPDAAPAVAVPAAAQAEPAAPATVAPSGAQQ